MRGRLVHRVTADDVGRRVSVRHRLPDDASHGTTDVVGRLEGLEDGVLLVTTRSGRVEVAEADVLASRVVPEPPTRAR